ncbi:hypothetical protein BC830DRAFT_1119228 [Chytriomyces sp. MP71]|nr:hypothetical protein BC830DRAFT_1119228 [Chytriomyces sp. MP71]
MFGLGEGAPAPNTPPPPYLPSILSMHQINSSTVLVSHPSVSGCPTFRCVFDTQQMREAGPRLKAEWKSLAVRRAPLLHELVPSFKLMDPDARTENALCSLLPQAPIPAYKGTIGTIIFDVRIVLEADVISTFTLPSTGGRFQWHGPMNSLVKRPEMPSTLSLVIEQDSRIELQNEVRTKARSLFSRHPSTPEYSSWVKVAVLDAVPSKEPTIIHGTLSPLSGFEEVALWRNKEDCAAITASAIASLFAIKYAIIMNAYKYKKGV